MTNPLPPTPAEMRAERVRQYTYTPFQRITQRARGLMRAAVNSIRAASVQTAVTPGWLGFDASVWQSSIDFNYAKSAGLLWVYLRALYGLIVDGKFPIHFPLSKGVMPRAAYLYYLDNQDSKAQAQKLKETCLQNGDIGDYQPVLDLENINNPTLTLSKIKLCLEELEIQFGKVPIIYSGYYVINGIAGDKAFLSKYMLIIAAYPFINWTPDLPQKVLNYPPLIPAPFTMWTSNPDEPLVGRVVGWQICANAPASQFGVSGNNLDLDWCSPAFQKQVLEAGTDPPPDPEPDPQGELQMQFIDIGANANIRKTPGGEIIGSIPGDQTVIALEMFIGNGYLWISFAVPPEWLNAGKTGSVGWAAVIAVTGNKLMDFHAAVPCPPTGVPMTEEQEALLNETVALSAQNEARITTLESEPPASGFEFVPTHKAITPKPNGEKLGAYPDGGEAVMVKNNELLMFLKVNWKSQKLMAVMREGVPVTGWAKDEWLQGL